jgi:hypothetical protein
MAVIRSTTPDQRYEALSWFVYNLFGSTLPIWLGGYILLPIFAKHFDWVEYSSHGELALYCAAFLAPTLRLIGKDVDDSVFVRRQTFLFLGWIFLTAAVALYSGVISASSPVNTRLLFGVSAFLFAFSVIFSSLVRLIDYQRIQPKQIFEIQRASETRLDENFDRTGSTSYRTAREIQEATAEEPSDESLKSASARRETPDGDSTAAEGGNDGDR